MPLKKTKVLFSLDTTQLTQFKKLCHKLEIKYSIKIEELIQKFLEEHK